MAKQLMKNYLPAFIRPFAKSVYRKFKKYTPAEIAYNNRLSSLKEAHTLLNKNAEANQIVIREGVCLNIHPESKNY